MLSFKNVLIKTNTPFNQKKVHGKICKYMDLKCITVFVQKVGNEGTYIS
jgi:hypothetical protein